MTIGIRLMPACDEDCNVCDKSLRRGQHVEIETYGFIVRLCKRCAMDAGSAAS